jgi:hypothetical protein
VYRLGELPYIQRLSKGKETGNSSGGRKMHSVRKRGGTDSMYLLARERRN